jgi:hypothetical protein
VTSDPLAKDLAIFSGKKVEDVVVDANAGVVAEAAAGAVVVRVHVKGDSKGWKEKAFPSEADAEKWLDKLADKVGGYEALEVKWAKDEK